MKADGAHTHGGGRSAVRAGAIGAVLTVAAYLVIIAGFAAVVEWVAAVVGTAVAVLGLVIWRKWPQIRADFKPDYVRRIHGKTPHELALEENARLRAEIAEDRALRASVTRTLQIREAVDRMYYGNLAPGWMQDPDYAQKGTVTGRFESPPPATGLVWEAEIVENPGELEESGP